MGRKKSNREDDSKLTEHNFNKKIRRFNGVVVRYGLSDLVFTDEYGVAHAVNLYEAIIGSVHVCLVTGFFGASAIVSENVRLSAARISPHIERVFSMDDAVRVFKKMAVGGYGTQE